MHEKEAVQLRRIGKRLGEVEVLRDFTLNFPMEQGNVVGIMGRSGCGKTTLLHLLAGILKPDQGEIFYPRKMKCSMVFQEDRVIESLNARDNIRLVLSEGGGAQLADLCLQRCGLTDAGHLYPSEMSGGMRRRLAIARAVAFQGDMLLLDEPFQGLDDQTADAVARLVFRGNAPFKKPDLTVLVTHSRAEAMKYADRLLTMDGPPLAIQADTP